MNDSIVDSLTISKPIHYYSLQPEDNAILVAGYYQQENISTNHIKFISPSGKVIIEDNMWVFEQLFTSILSKDSIYYFEFSGDPSCVYTLITSEDEQPEISYGNTLDI